MVNELFTISLIIVLTYLLGEFCKLIKIPRVLGHLSVGILLGPPYIKAYLFDENALNIINSLADIAVIFLFFFVGLNINLREFKHNIKESFAVSFFTSLLPLLAGFLISRFLLDYELLTSIIIGIVLSATSQIIAVNLLEELKIFKTKVGNLIVTSGATNDVFELVLISIILSILNLETSALGYLRILNIAIFIVVLFILRFLIFPHILRFFERSKSNTSMFSAGIIIALITAILSDLFGLGTLVGALFSGVIIRQILLTGKHPKPWEEHSISKSVHLISYGFLVPIFFVAVGLKTDLFSLTTNINLVLIFLAIAFIGTVGGSILGVMLSKGSFKEGAIVGFGINSRGDLEVVIATLALQVGLFTTAIFSSVVMMAFFTTLISPIIFKYLATKYKYYLNVKH